MPEQDLGISVDEMAEMIQRNFESIGTPSEVPKEDHSLRIDYDNLKFGTEYSKDKK